MDVLLVIPSDMGFGRGFHDNGIGCLGVVSSHCHECSSGEARGIHTYSGPLGFGFAAP